MRKRILTPVPQETTSPDLNWLNIDEVAAVEISSEDAAHPVESALLAGGTCGWRAAGPAKQTIRLCFDQPQQLRRIWLKFIENHAERTQEFVLRCSRDDGQSFQEIVRQQWNFSPNGATSETEDLYVELAAVTVLELSIIPDISGGDSVATLEQMRLA